MGLQSNEGLLSPFLKRYRLNSIRCYSKGNVLDFGCGSGSAIDYIEFDSYLGYDSDHESIIYAKSNYPKFDFTEHIDILSGKIYDTILLIALIEHIKDPIRLVNFLESISSNTTSILITTPNPYFRFFYKIGAHLGLFSKSAEKEHFKYYNRKDISLLFNKVGMEVIFFKYFLFGANQLFIVKKI
jgi:2-polyprenyl-3-methyl-5-hydroxy-6-metoxy-1,4-benzoquinol methylase